MESPVMQPESIEMGLKRNACHTHYSILVVNKFPGIETRIEFGKRK